MSRLQRFARRIRSFVLGEIAKMGEAAAAAIDAHAANGTAHVTAVEREAWTGACAMKPITIPASGWVRNCRKIID